MTSLESPRSPSSDPEELEGVPEIRPERAHNVPKHIRKFYEFEKDVAKTIERLYPVNGRRYQRAAVLAIDFSRTDLDVASLREELFALFRNTYNFETEYYQIDSNDNDTDVLAKLGKQMHDFHTKYATWRSDENVLLIYYFSGHGERGALHTTDPPLMLSGALTSYGELSRPKLDWNKIMWGCYSVRMYPGNHQLCILDCCSAGLAALGEDIEVLGATSWDETARSSPQRSFTHALLEELRFANGMSITATQLISNLYNKKALAKNDVIQPIHKRSSNPNREPALFHKITSSNKPLPQVRGSRKYANVTISVRVLQEETVPDAPRFSRWLSSDYPEDEVGSFQIEAKWQSGFVMVIITLPIAIWLDLPAKPAYQFVSLCPSPIPRLPATSTPLSPRASVP